jgi:HlyD family secretion protein
VNQPATFTVDAYPGQVFTGTVTSIRQAPINVANVITYDAVIGVSNPDLKLFPGMTANVKILVNQRLKVLKVPNAALRYRPASETAAVGSGRGAGRGAAPEMAVWILNPDNKPQRVTVTTGETDGAYTEIATGELKVGDLVILAALAKSGSASGNSPGSQSGFRGGRGPGF